MGEERLRKVTRRDFLKGTAVGAAGLATSAVIGGCQPAAQPAAQPTPCPTCPPCPTPAPAAAVPEKASWEVPPPPIPDKDIKETITTEVVVLGGGVGGMTAALSAAEAGAKVILLEKNPTYTARGGHNAAIGSKLQKQLGIEINKEEVIADLVRWAGNKVDQRLIRLWADNCGRIMDWLIDMAEAAGITVSMYQWPRPYPVKDEYYREWPTAHMFGGMNEANLVKLLEDNALKKGADLRYETTAVQLIREGKGRVTGVVARTAEGDYVRFNATKGIILCTGDYGNNPEMMQKYCSWAADIARESNIYTPPVNTGDGHKMGLWVGAAMDPTPHPPMIHTFGGGPCDASPFLQVNARGERYHNEDVPDQYLANQALLQPGGRFYWQIFDAKWEEEVPRMGAGLGRCEAVTDFTRKSLQSAIERGSTVTANTIEELAQKMGVPVENLKATVDRYNELARLGQDLDFGKRPDRLTTIEKPPFYAAKSPVYFLVVVGGLKINTKLQVLDTEGNVIPGLYAAGNASGGFFANDYPVACPGLSHSRAWTFGYLAGKNVAAEKV